MNADIDDSITRKCFRASLNKSPPTGLARQNITPLKFAPKPSETAFLVGFTNFEKCRPEAAADVISGVTMD